MSALLIGSLIGGALGLGKAIFGGVQASKGNKQMKSLLANRPTYTIPDAYQKALSVYGQMAQGGMPGQQYYEDRIGESTARAIGSAERGAISSNVFQGAVSNAQDKELQALQDLARMGAEYKTNAMSAYAQAQNQYGQLQDRAFDYNVAQPYDIKLNMANERKMAGQQNLMQGLGEVGSSVMNYVGTKYYGDILKSLQGQ